MEILIQVALILIAFTTFFLVLWMSISLLMSRVSGWAKLAKHYAASSDEQGKTYYMCSGYIGSVRYKSCLTLCACKNGLRLSMLFLFRMGHPPLFIPWDQFHNVSEKRMLFARLLNASIGRPTLVKVTLPIWVREYLPDESNPDWGA